MKNFTHRLRAFAAGRPDQPRAEIPPVTVEGTTAVMRLYDPVDSWGEYWGVSAKEFVTALDENSRRTRDIEPIAEDRERPERGAVVRTEQLVAPGNGRVQ